MATRGRPPRPVEQKRLLGNPGHRPLPDEQSMDLIPMADSIPEPSRPLAKPGLDLWTRIWELGINWVSPNTDYELLLMTCELVDERWNLRAKVLQTDDRHQRRQLLELSRMIISNLSLLGFTPTDRARLGLAEVKAQSKIAEMQAKRAARS